MHEFTRVGIELTDGRNFSIKGRKPKVDHRNYPSVALRFPGTNVDPEFIWERDRLDEYTSSIRLHVSNTTRNSFFIEKTIVYTTPITPALIGFITAKEQRGHVEKEERHINAFTFSEGLKLSTGEKMSSETLLVSFDHDPQRAVERYEKSVVKDMRLLTM